MDNGSKVEIGDDDVTRNGGRQVTVVPKTAADLFIEEYGDDWGLEMVTCGIDDAGKVINIFVEDSQGDDLRNVAPSVYSGYRTIVIGVEKGWGGAPDAAVDQ